MSFPVGTRYSPNQIELMDGKYDSKAYSGRSITVSGNGAIPVPINATLSGEEYSGTSGYDGVDSSTAITDGYNIKYVAGGDSASAHDSTATYTESVPIVLSFNANIIGGGFKIYGYYDGTAQVIIDDYIVTEGYNEIVVGASASYGEVFLYVTYDPDTDIDVTNYSIKEITAVQGSVTAFKDTAHVQETNLPLSTTFNLTDGTYSSICQLATNHFSAEDLAYFDSDHSALLKWALGTVTIPSGIVYGTEDKFYACSEEHGVHLLELDYSEGSEQLIDGDFSNPSSWVLNGNTSIADGTMILDISDNNVANYQNTIISSGVYNIVIDSKTFTNADGSANFRARTGVTYYDKILKAGINSFIVTHDGVNTYFYIYNFLSNAVIDSVSMRLITSEYITVTGTSSRNSQSPYGLQTLSCELNSAGVPTALLLGEFNVKDGGYLNTGWRPDFEIYTIEWEGDGESRVFTHDAYSSDHYYVNGAEVTPTPEAPNPNATILLNNIAPIGNPDSVDRVQGDFKAHNVVLTPEQINAQ